MKIGIFETEHFEGSYPVIKLFDNDKSSITVFTYAPAYRQFRHLFGNKLSRYDWVVKSGNESKYRFILKMFKEIKKKNISLLYLNTVSNNFIFYALLVLFLPKTRVVLTIHNINSQFQYKMSFSFRRLIRYLGRRLLISVTSEFNVVALPMVKNLVSKLPLRKKVYCLPGAIFEATNQTQSQPLINTHVNIVVPGTVDGRRRDYLQCFKLINILEENRIPATITFLGRFYDSYGNQILETIKTLNLHHTCLKYYESDTVDQPEFDRVMNSASFVFIPSVINTIIEDGIVETYGKTMSSGNLFDVIKHAKPFIIPNTLEIDSFLESSCFRYIKLEEVADFIKSSHNNPDKYSNLLALALKSSENYTIQKIQERNKPLFS
jgi:hypothetical protein